MYTPHAPSALEPVRVLIARPERRRLQPLFDSPAPPVIVTSVHDGWDVLAVLGRARFDLVVLDLTPCDLDPMQLIAMVRAAGLTTPFRVVVDSIDRPLRLQAARLARVSLAQRGRGAANDSVAEQPATLARAASR